MYILNKLLTLKPTGLNFCTLCTVTTSRTFWNVPGSTANSLQLTAYSLQLTAFSIQPSGIILIFETLGFFHDCFQGVIIEFHKFKNAFLVNNLCTMPSSITSDSLSTEFFESALFLPHSAQRKDSSYRMAEEVVLSSDKSSQPATQPASQPPSHQPTLKNWNILTSEVQILLQF